jgi:hypothetical protein
MHENMATVRGNVILTDSSRFEVLGSSALRFPTRGLGIMRTSMSRTRWERYSAVMRNAVAVADVSLDPEEPDIRNCDETNIAAADRELEEGVRCLMEADGRRFKRWMNSHLIDLSSRRHNVTGGN